MLLLLLYVFFYEKKFSQYKKRRILLVDIKNKIGLSFNDSEANEEKWKNTNKKDFVREEIDVWVEVIRDKWLTFYIVQEWETLEDIYDKLSNTKEFSYLKNKSYKLPKSKNQRNINSFNILPRHIKPGMYIPIPIKETQREMNIIDFVNYSKEAISKMKQNDTYGKKIRDRIDLVWWEDELASIMVAFARSETAIEYSSFNSSIWDVELHRWEGKYRVFSFSYYHILMEWVIQGKKAGPWL